MQGYLTKHPEGWYVTVNDADGKMVVYGGPFKSKKVAQDYATGATEEPITWMTP